MASSQSLGGSTRCGKILGPSFDKIIKNVAWRKHTNLVAACKSAIDKLETLTEQPSLSLSSPIPTLSPSDADAFLSPLLLALDTASPKIIDPALDALFRLFSNNLLRFELDRSSDDNSNSLVFQLIESVCKCCGLGDELVQFCVMKVLLSAIRSPFVEFRGDYLNHIVKTCYNVYLGGLNGTNQICAKAVLAQIVLIVFARVEEDSMFVSSFKTITVSELLEFTDRNLSEGNSAQLVQNVINEVMDWEKPEENNEAGAKVEENTEPGAKMEENSDEGKPVVKSEGLGGSGERESLLREDGFMLFKNLCKLSMKFSSQEHSDDEILLRGKILSLELLKVIMDNSGLVWCSNESFLNIIKQFLCLSLLKNSALSVMTIFQLLCSIFMSLLSKFRSGLKSEIGIFFPMLILRVLENITQPRFIQKMTVLNLLEKISQDPQLIIDIFVNYDCDLDAPNIYERTVNGLLKTALGPAPGSTTPLSPVKDLTFRVESVKCLVRIVKSMGVWMDQQLKIGETSLSNRSSVMTGSVDMHSALNGEEGMIADYELHPESNTESSDAATFEQRRAYKLEIQKGITLFNRKPSKGVDFLINTKKVGGSPEDVASFLKNTSGLNPTVIGDYLGEREDFPLKVMHAYVDGFNFEKMDFGEAIRYFLRGFRLPGEAQKIDRIMEKFAERYCKCNPNSFKSADTAYVLAYSVILLNTDAHNNMVKDKMTKADFLRNNRGIDDGKDLPEEYLGAIYDQIVKNEIKMNAETSQPQSKQVNGLNRLLGLDGILNLVMGKQPEEKPLGTNGLLIKNIQEQFKTKSGKSESVFYAVSDVSILRFMVEVCWGPMLAAFSMTLDQSDDKLATSECLQGFRYAVHVTAVLSMQTQRDAFVTSLAKFTYLHCAADMKQKNIDAMKTIMSIAIEDGNYLQEAWEHILTCLSRFEHLQLLGEGVPPDASFLSMSNAEPEQKSLKSSELASLKKKGALQNPAVAAVVRGGSYDSSALGANHPKLVTSEQVTNFISNLHLLDQIGSYELNHIFAHSQRMNSEAIVAFVRALCKVSMAELQSPTDPRVFSLTKIVEIAHYNMNRIRLVWSRIWNVLSDFFVSVGLSENLSVAIFVMDSLRQLAMKFLEREELANYNFQNEFLRPFVIVMQKSSSAEIRELIVRCISQMVLSRVSNVKSGWKSVFLVFTTAAADERKSIVLLAFETMEKIVREYFPHITETESTTFTDCVKCLITFTKSKFDSDVSFNAIAFLRFCALKLAEGGLFCNEDSQDANSYDLSDSGETFDRQPFTSKDENISFWMPLLTGLSRLTSDPRPVIRKSSVEVLFNILMDHGSLFSRPFWSAIFKFVVFPILSCKDDTDETEVNDEKSLQTTKDSSHGTQWDSETSSVAAQRLVDLFVTFFAVLRFQLPNAVTVLADFIKNPGPGPAKIGIAALVRLTSELGTRLSEDDWRGMLMAIKDAAASTLPGFLRVLRTMDNINIPDAMQSYHGLDSDNEISNNDLEDDDLQTAAYVVSRMKGHIAVQLVIIQLVTDLYKTHHDGLSEANLKILLELFSMISSHANQLSSEGIILRKLQTVCNMLELTDPPVVHFENESYQSYLEFLNDLVLERPTTPKDIDLEAQLVAVCEKILVMYVECAGTHFSKQKPADEPEAHWILPLLSAKKEELAARSTLLLSALRTLTRLEKDSFRRYISRIFPLLVGLVKSEHSSREVLPILSDMFQTCIGPIIVES
uniref:SEC7 domain-containing protein n=1 Tax=Chenopodium quinoa TaxID=63459 RepID=A0A803LGV1_CHEQI